MKQFLITILALLHLASATGATLHVHYCMGKYVGSSLSDHSRDHKCGKCGMQKNAKNSCCKDEFKLVKAKISDHTIAGIFSFTPQSLPAILPAHSTIYVREAVCALNSHLTPKANAPPRSGHCPVYLALRNIRV